MQWFDVLKRVEEGETEQTEFNSGLGDLAAVGETICAFANTRGGVLIVGVDNAGQIVGVREDPEKAQERLTSFLQSGCSAPVLAWMGCRQDPRGWVHWVDVPAQPGLEPMRFKGQVRVRRGRSSVTPSPSELQDLYNAFGYILTEEQYIQAVSRSDIDLRAFLDFLRVSGIDTDADPQPTGERDLINRGVLVDVNGDLYATLYGVMAFGRDPQQYPQTRNFWIDCTAYGGTDASDAVLLQGDAKGRLDEQVKRAVGWLRSLGRLESYGDLVRRDVPLVPVKVLREALVNAVAHRDYALVGSKILLQVFVDRLEITSPGALPNHMTPESAMAGGYPRSRNELMANFLVTKGMMEQRGRGWPIMRRAMREFNGTEPGLQHAEGARSVRVVLRFGEAVDEDPTI